MWKETVKCREYECESLRKMIELGMIIRVGFG